LLKFSIFLKRKTREIGATTTTLAVYWIKKWRNYSAIRPLPFYLLPNLMPIQAIRYVSKAKYYLIGTKGACHLINMTLTKLKCMGWTKRKAVLALPEARTAHN
jgi:hypothetical protein